MVKIFNVNDIPVGDGQPCFVIAEAGVNHNGDLARAIALIDAAAEAGASAVKFQTFKAKRLVTLHAPKAAYQLRNEQVQESQLEMLQRLELTEDDHRKLFTHCRKRGVLFMSTPFEEQSADLLYELGVSVFKVPSGEMTNLPFLEHLARLGKPLVVSTGMCSLGEVEAAVETIERAGNDQIILLHCVSNYPADPADVNLRAMDTMRVAFGYPVGYSDHTLGISVGMASVAMGATVVEKHFTLDRNLPGPDHRASLEPGELKELIAGIRTIEIAMGTGRKSPVESERDTALVARKSLVAAEDIPVGTILTNELIAIKRPGTGLPPIMRLHLINRTTTCDIPAGSLIRLENVA